MNTTQTELSQTGNSHLRLQNGSNLKDGCKQATCFMTALSEMKEKRDGFTLVCFKLWLFFASGACLVCPD